MRIIAQTCLGFCICIWKSMHPSSQPAMHACIHTYYAHACIYVVQMSKYTYMHTMHACMHACMHAYTHTYIHTYLLTYLLTYTHSYMGTKVFACIRAYTQRAYLHTYIHTSLHFTSTLQSLSLRTKMWGQGSIGPGLQLHSIPWGGELELPVRTPKAKLITRQ